MLTGELPHHVDTQVAFRWIDDNSALIVGIECREPKMKRLVESCKESDSMRIFGDDMVEIRLETAGGIRPFIGINSAGVVFDECITQRVEDLPAFYRVGQAAVKKTPTAGPSKSASTPNPSPAPAPPHALLSLGSQHLPPAKSRQYHRVLHALP